MLETVRSLILLWVLKMIFFIRCCNTCEDVKAAYNLKKWQLIEIDKIEQCQSTHDAEKIAKALKEGCQIYGYMEVNRVSTLQF